MTKPLFCYVPFINVLRSAQYNFHTGDDIRTYSEHTRLRIPGFAVVHAEGNNIWLKEGACVVQLHRNQFVLKSTSLPTHSDIEELIDNNSPLPLCPYPTLSSTILTDVPIPNDKNFLSTS